MNVACKKFSADKSCTELAQGDCGSAVVDSQNFELYGHVIGVNPLGYAYVIPFDHTIKQVTYSFGTSSVALPGSASSNREKEAKFNDLLSSHYDAKLFRSSVPQQIKDTVNVVPSPKSPHVTAEEKGGNFRRFYDWLLRMFWYVPCAPAFYIYFEARCCALNIIFLGR